MAQQKRQRRHTQQKAGARINFIPLRLCDSAAAAQDINYIKEISFKIGPARLFLAATCSLIAARTFNEFIFRFCAVLVFVQKSN